MTKDWKYFLYVATAVGLFVVVKLLSPKQHDWTVTFSHEDKNPYGAFALGKLLPQFFDDNIRHSYQTLYELRDSLKKTDNIIIIASAFSAGKEDCAALLNHVSDGGSAFISAQYFRGHFADTLNVGTYDYFFTSQDITTSNDSAAIRFVNPMLDTTAAFFYRRANIHDYFSEFDTTKTMVIATNERNLPVAIRVAWGKGNLILNCTPLAFTNIYVLSGNRGFPSGMLSYLPTASVLWTEYYHLGRQEIGTPLRFVLTNKPLRWGYYIAVFLILMFILFEVRRKQRLIPIIKPLRNTTLEFVRTIADLYFQRGDHKNIAEKKILFLLETIRSNYWVNTSKLDKNFTIALAGKTGRSEQEIEELVNTIKSIQQKESVSSHELIDFNSKIERFNRTGATQ